MDFYDLVIGANNVVFNPIYVLSISAGFAFIFLFPLINDFTSTHEKTQYYFLQLITLPAAVRMHPVDDMIDNTLVGLVLCRRFLGADNLHDWADTVSPHRVDPRERDMGFRSVA